LPLEDPIQAACRWKTLSKRRAAERPYSSGVPLIYLFLCFSLLNYVTLLNYLTLLNYFTLLDYVTLLNDLALLNYFALLTHTA
jgi:hypothetical protein